MRRITPLDKEFISPGHCSPALRLSLLRKAQLFARLDDSQLSEVGQLFRERGYSKGETVYSRDNLARVFDIVAQGYVKLVRHTVHGQDVLLEILGPGDTFGTLPMFGDESHNETAEAKTACCLLTITANDLQAIVERYPQVGHTLLTILSEKLRSARETIQQTSAAPVESRIAASLVELSDRLGRDDGGGILIQVPLTRQDLADMTGAQAETVSRIMSRFRKDGLIGGGRGWVAILDRNRLAEISAGSSA